jgi:hypothetical protein
MKELEDVLYEIVESLAENSKKNMEIIEKVEKLLNNIKEQDKHILEDLETKQKITDFANNNLLEDNTNIMERRIEYHKKMGTYQELPQKEESRRKEDEYPKITPLMKLSPSEREQLYKQIFNEAKYNIEILLDIKKDSPDYKEKLFEESNRLLDIWMEKNKTKNI